MLVPGGTVSALSAIQRTELGRDINGNYAQMPAEGLADSSCYVDYYPERSRLDAGLHQAI